MFSEVKAMLPVSGDLYDAEIVLQINAAALDLTRTAEIVLPGEIAVSRDPVVEDEKITGWEITDESTVTDALVITAIATWCAARIGNPPNYERLLAAYESMKGSLRLSNSYTEYRHGHREHPCTPDAEEPGTEGPGTDEPGTEGAQDGD